MFNIYLHQFIPWTVLIPISVGIFFYAKLTGGIRYILFYTCTAALCNVLAYYLMARYSNNMPMFHVYAVIEFTLCALFFRKALEGTRLARYLPAVIFSFAVLSILNSIYIQDIFSFNSYSRSLEAVIIIIFCLFYMYRMLGSKKRSKEENAFLMISVGLFLYFSGSLFLFMFSRYLLVNQAAIELGWGTHAFLVFAMNVFFAIAFYQSRRTV